MKTKNHSRNLAAALAVAALITSAQAAVVFSTTGVASYTYSASGPAAGSALPPGSDATLSNITIARYTQFSAATPNVRGLTNVGGTTGTATWHFQTGPGLTFSNDINLSVGTGRNSSGTVVGQYSFDNTNWTSWFSSTALDQTYSATNVANGQTDLYVRYTFNGTTAGNTVITWGGTAGERPFTLNGTVVPEPSAALLGGLGMLALLRRRRN